MASDSDLNALFGDVARYAAAWRAQDATRPAAPREQYAASRERMRLPPGLPGCPAGEAVAELIAKAEPGLGAMTSPRFHAWVMGAANPAGVAADWLTSTWGQNAGNEVATPSAAAAETAAAEALLELMDLPREAAVGFATGATMANFTCLAAARAEVLRRAGWDIEADGLQGAPPIHVVAGEEAHSTIFASLKYLGFGMRRLIRVASDAQGAQRADAFADAVAGLDGPIIAVAQAGHIITGAVDPVAELAEALKGRNAWLHVDGAFGLWVRAADDVAAAARGLELADSWGVDGHKWLQTPYDCAYAIVRDAEALRRAMRIPASYLPTTSGRNPSDFVPELSRRARGFATWAVLRHLGREGVAATISRCCAMARRYARRLGQEPDIRILNDVVMNQVAVRLGADLPKEAADRLTREAIARIQQEGVVFLGGAEWRGDWVLRISVCGEGTREADVDMGCEAILKAWRAVRAA